VKWILTPLVILLFMLLQDDAKQLTLAVVELLISFTEYSPLQTHQHESVSKNFKTERRRTKYTWASDDEFANISDMSSDNVKATWQRLSFDVLFKKNTNRAPKVNEGTWLMKKEFRDILVARNLDEPLESIDWIMKKIRHSPESMHAYFAELFSSVVWVFNHEVFELNWWADLYISNPVARSLLLDFNGHVAVVTGDDMWHGPYDTNRRKLMIEDRRMFDPMNGDSAFIRNNAEPRMLYLQSIAKAMSMIRKKCVKMGWHGRVKLIDEGRRVSAHARAQSARQIRMVNFGRRALKYFEQVERISDDLYLSQGHRLEGEIRVAYRWIREIGQDKLARQMYIAWLKDQRRSQEDDKLKELLHNISQELIVHQLISPLSKDFTFPSGPAGSGVSLLPP